MEGFLLAAPVTEHGGKKPWQTDFVRFDDISAQLLGFADRSQADLKWKLHLKDADVATPVPGDPKHANAPNVDDTPHCFYVHEVTSCGQEIRVFLSAPDDETKKKWVKVLQQAAKVGPHPPCFSGSLSPRVASGSPKSQQPYRFEARVTQVRLHSDGKHAEYMVTCHVAIFSRVANRRLTKEWNIWHRFSEFDALNEALKASLGAEKMADVPFFKTHRDAIRSLFGWWSLDQDFLDHRRLLLDTFITRVCAINEVVEFFQPHSDAALKKFVAFDEHCEDVDHCPRKTSHQKSPRKTSEQLPTGENLRTSDMSPRDSDNTSASFSSAVMSPVAASPPKPEVGDAAEETKIAKTAADTSGSRKKGKGGVRQPVPTSGKKGKKKN